MSDVVLFIMGCLVSLVVASAVGLLLWGAANEPRGSILPDKNPDSGPPSGSNAPAPVSALNVESKSPA